MAASWNLPVNLRTNRDSVFETSHNHQLYSRGEDTNTENMQIEELEGDIWKMSVKHQLEQELDRRVREALDTPPGERLRRQQKEARLRAMRNREEMEMTGQENMGYNNKEFNHRDRLWLRERRLRMFKNNPNRSAKRSDSESSLQVADPVPVAPTTANQFSHWTGVSRLSEQEEDTTSHSKAVRFSDNVQTQTLNHFRTGREAMIHFGNLTEREKDFLFMNFTKEGFQEALRTGRLPDGTPLEVLPGGCYRDAYGIVRHRHGPFWPRERGPLHPTPVHRRLTAPAVEPLLDHTSTLQNEPTQTFDNQTTCYDGKWRGVQIVYDSEKSPRNFVPSPLAENMCPSVSFESRFECGNLRQARRIGQFVYELVLLTDLYTKRHTQWYYFRVSNAVPGITYKFIVVNFLKRGSLYNEGMRPLFYSEKCASKDGIGWYRSGHHIRYSRNVTHLHCPLLLKEMVYYQLEWQTEFEHANDTTYFAHCYPYSFTDLREDIENFVIQQKRGHVMKREILCETRAGNSCYLLTVTDPEIEEGNKCGVVVTGRVHPGESNASWMMRGFLDFISGDSDAASELRKRFIFKIVPMLNPDGVIVGNYRCSLAARDLNRNYRHPKMESFPTIYHVKEMMEKFGEKRPVIIYCDMHGHSRKQNVFMYGCDSQYRKCDNVNLYKPKASLSNAQEFISDRIFPWLIAKKAPFMFSFNGCKFNIRRCKESTGRVVMWRQLEIENSFTMEATFSGTTLDKENTRHFNVKDFENMGQLFGESVMDYQTVQDCKERQTEVVVEMTRELMFQILESRGLLSKAKLQAARNAQQDPQGASGDTGSQDLKELLAAAALENSKAFGANIDEKSQDKAVTREKINELIDTMSTETLEGCFRILEKLDVGKSIAESDSSDSDSESEPEAPPPPELEKTVKKKKKTKRSRDGEKKTAKSKKDVLEATTSEEASKTSEKPKRANRNQLTQQQQQQQQQGNFVSKYEGRTNGGIPCFSEERLLERAAKRLYNLQRKNEDTRLRNTHILLCEDGQSGDALLEARNASAEIDRMRRKLQQVLRHGGSGQDEHIARTLQASRMTGRPPLPLRNEIILQEQGCNHGLYIGNVQEQDAPTIELVQNTSQPYQPIGNRSHHWFGRSTSVPNVPQILPANANQSEPHTLHVATGHTTTNQQRPNQPSGVAKNKDCASIRVTKKTAFPVLKPQLATSYFAQSYPN